MKKFVSIIVRTKNEERWINLHLRSLFNQSYKNFEVIIVDNNSDDSTLEIVNRYKCKVVELENFKPGLAINDGIRASKGDLIAIISAHCIPKNKFWLENLVKEFSDNKVAGVYGRQIPFSFTDPNDKRDLYNTFGVERKIQTKDSYFHNANSMIRRDLWEQIKFDEITPNIEDRLWAYQIINLGYNLVYNPDAVVYHWHGLNHYQNQLRANNISNILGQINEDGNNYIDPKQDNIGAFLPYLVEDDSLISKSISEIEELIGQLEKSKFISKVFLYCNSPEVNKHFKNNKRLIILPRSKKISIRNIHIFDILNEALLISEKKYDIIDSVVLITTKYNKIRNPKLIDKVIDYHYYNGSEFTVVAKEENRGIIIESEGKIELLGEGYIPAALKKTKLWISLLGYSSIFNSYILRSKKFKNLKINYYEI